jgi:hypothetical protein
MARSTADILETKRQRVIKEMLRHRGYFSRRQICDASEVEYHIFTGCVRRLMLMKLVDCVYDNGAASTKYWYRLGPGARRVLTEITQPTKSGRVIAAEIEDEAPQRRRRRARGRLVVSSDYGYDPPSRG